MIIRDGTPILSQRYGADRVEDMDISTLSLYKTRMDITFRSAQVRLSYFYLPSGPHEPSLFTILRAGWLDAAPGEALNRATCPGDDIIYCLSGKGSVTISGTEIPVGPGQLVWIPGDRPHGHASSMDDPWSVMWCRIKGGDLLSLRNRILGRTDFRLTIKTCDTIIGWFNIVFSLLRLQTADTDLRLNTAISNLFELLVDQKRAEPKGRSPRSLDQVVAAMCANPSAPWKTAEIENVAGASVAQIRRLFQKHIGLTPREFLRSQRLLMAQKLMLETSQTLDEISMQCGFSDPYHFSKDFRRVVGRAPSDWRRVEIGS